MDFVKQMKFSIKTLFYVKSFLFWDSEISGISENSETPVIQKISEISEISEIIELL